MTRTGRRHAPPRTPAAVGMHERELTPEDIFNMFFGMPPQHRRAAPRAAPRAAARRRRGDEHQPHQLAPLFLLLASPCSPRSAWRRQPFLRRSADCSIERQTVASGVRYWVSESFELLHVESEQLRKVSAASSWTTNPNLTRTSPKPHPNLTPPPTPTNQLPTNLIRARWRTASNRTTTAG